jgi:hypothetical protein
LHDLEQFLSDPDSARQVVILGIGTRYPVVETILGGLEVLLGDLCIVRRDITLETECSCGPTRVSTDSKKWPKVNRGSGKALA